MQPYSDDFYTEIGEPARRSARRMVPMVLELTQVGSVVDIGCGRGTWLAAFADHGVDDLVGVDGLHVDVATLEIPAGRFVGADLERPLGLGRTFDLAVSLEVAEHLRPAAAETFVDSLCALAPVVLFSAAVPSQGGVHHVNEQWPGYWAAKFLRRGYSCVDVLRQRVWEDPEVSWWYAQNACLYVHRDALASHPRLAEHASTATPPGLAHPALVERNRARMRHLEAFVALLAAVADGSRVIVVDDGTLAHRMAAVRHFTWLPFLERDGAYWGPPVDDAAAVAELERMRNEGATAIAFVWPSTWWLEHYAAFAQHLAGRYPQVAHSDHLTVYDLRSRH